MSQSQVAERVNRIKPSPSSMAAQRARELKDSGKDILSLTTGEPDFDTPQHILDGAYEAMKRGETRYTATGGTKALKDAIIAKFSRENGLDYTPAQIMAGTGVKQIIFNAIMCTVDKGDEVLIPAPHWVSYPDMVMLAGGKPVSIECRIESGFKLTPEQLEAQLTENSKWLILNSPCNPSGAIYNASELRALGEVVARHPKLMVMTDDMYEHISYTGDVPVTFAAANPQLKERTLTVNGVSKAYAMTGWRLGYCGGPKWLISQMVKLQSQSTSNPSAISQAGAVVALDGPQDFLADRAASFRARRDLVVERLNQIEGIECPTPEGAFYVYPSCRALIGKKTPEGKVLETDEDVCLYFLDSVGVAVVQGSAFGLSPHFRISFATSEEVLVDACARLKDACARLTA